MRTRSFAILPCLASVPIAAILTGCAGMSPTALSSPSAENGFAIQGMIHGGQQPIVGAHVYLLQVNTTGNAGAGIAASSSNASVSILSASSTGTSDTNGAYVLSGSNGSFTITGDYQCTANTQLYLYALGGNPGAGANSAAGLLAALGNCPSTGSFASSTPYVFINEVSTVASAYALAGFATDAMHISTSGSTRAQTDISNAMLNAPNLESLATGQALATTPAGNGTVPQSTINTIANILASCINSTGPTSTSCTTLFNAARSTGSTGTTPTDTATAAINIAHNPGANVATLFGLASASAQFSPTLTTAPNDFLIGITYGAGGGLNGAFAIAIDAQGSAWFTNVNTNTISKLSSTGAPLSPAGGFTNPNPAGSSTPTGIAIDLNGNAWVVDSVSSNLLEFSNGGTLLSPATGYVGGGLNKPQGVAIDGSGNIFAANFGSSTAGSMASVSKFNASGVALSGVTGYTDGTVNEATSIAIDNSGEAWLAAQMPSPGTLAKFNSDNGVPFATNGYQGGGLNNPQGIAIDASNNVWAADFNGNAITNYNGNGNLGPISSSGYSGGGLSNPKAIALDGAGNVWVANYGANDVSEFTNAGVAISPSSGFAVGGFNQPGAVEIDGSGDVWIANQATAVTTVNAVTELIGAAVPRVTPLSVAISLGKLGSRP
jgi:sugar lactone lactonase YvrE